MRPATRVLIKLFAYRFYKANAGLFLFFFVSVLISFFFVNVLNQTHLNAEEKLINHLGIVLAFVSAPPMLALFFTAWLAYMIKSWSFIQAQFHLPQNHFLFYSLNALPRAKQFWRWLAVQTVIALPLWVYGLFALFIGVLFGHYLYPVIILIYIILLTTGGAAICLNYTNRFADARAIPRLIRFTQNWPKPFFSLILYNTLHRQKTTLIITKLLSASILASGVFLLDTATDVRAVGIIALGVATTHAYIIFTAYRFTLTYLSFTRNFPYTSLRLFTYTLSAYLFITLPELTWFFYYAPAVASIQAFGLIAGTTTLFHAILFRIGPVTKKFLNTVFYVFVTFFLAILVGLLPVLAPISCVVAFMLFWKNYHTQKTVAG
jgi:hypothetical protein